MSSWLMSEMHDGYNNDDIITLSVSFAQEKFEDCHKEKLPFELMRTYTLANFNTIFEEEVLEIIQL